MVGVRVSSALKKCSTCVASFFESFKQFNTQRHNILFIFPGSRRLSEVNPDIPGIKLANVQCSLFEEGITYMILSIHRIYIAPSCRSELIERVWETQSVVSTKRRVSAKRILQEDPIYLPGTPSFPISRNNFIFACLFRIKVSVCVCQLLLLREKAHGFTHSSP